MKPFTLVSLGAMLASALMFAAGANAGSPKTEIGTAHAHALMAQSAKSVDMAHQHLHHVVNCLVGPMGQGFDAAAGNPCKGQGDGALVDSNSHAKLHGKLQSALADAQKGLKADSLDAVQADAAKAAAALQATPTQ